MIIRTIRDEDIGEVLSIEVECFTVPWSEESFRAPLNHSAYRIMVIEEEGRVVGYACMMFIIDEGELMNIAVAPEFRRRGYAGQLLDAMMTYGRTERRTNHFMLEVRESNSAAQALYRSRGFEETGRRKGYYTKPNEDAILMDWNC